MDSKPAPELHVELVPSSAWGNNLRKLLSKRDWDVVRRWQYARAGHRCEICGGRGPNHPVEAHELWQWDEGWGVQWLLGVIALCPTCHKVKHWGRSIQVAHNPVAESRRLMQHTMRVNRWSERDFQVHLELQAEQFERHSHYNWRMFCEPWLDAALHYGAFQLHDYQIHPGTNETNLLFPKEDFL